MTTRRVQSLDGLKRCPQCHLAPDVIVEGNGMTVFECPRHGHIATGDHLEQAVENWNHYISFMEKGT